MNKIHIFIFILACASWASAQPGAARDFRSVVDKRLRSKFGIELTKVCPIDTDAVANRVFRDYGAIFVANTGGPLPASCMMSSETAVASFQNAVSSDTEMVAGVKVTLQKSAMAAYRAARREAAAIGLSITPRGGSTASSRSFSTTVDLWKSRFVPALSYWTGKGKIKREDALTAQNAPLMKQVSMVLAWEDDRIFFSKDLSKSILYSVAIPGASQHNFMLALDVEQYGDNRVREIMAHNGWFQTVKSDLPHFTFLGVQQKELSSLGLEPVIMSGQTFWIPNL